MKFFLMAASLRKDSVNRKLATLIEKKLKDSGHEIQHHHFNEYDLPLYNADVEAQGFPANVQKFIDDINKVDGLIFVLPEYNFSVPGTFKNLFDWISRVQPMPWTGKKILLNSASPSQVGGARCLIHVRPSFEGCGAFLCPDSFMLANAYDAFNEDGTLKDKTNNSRLDATLKAFIKMTQQLSS
jgi:chromate reductase, NAD(P)H dehydrogenase (quinone)